MKLTIVAALILLGGSIAHPSPTRHCSITNCTSDELAALCTDPPTCPTCPTLPTCPVCAPIPACVLPADGVIIRVFKRHTLKNGSVRGKILFTVPAVSR